jgi:hypothetical protein
MATLYASSVCAVTDRVQDLVAVFQRGARALTRKAAVAVLKNMGFGKSATYEALSANGRFSTWLQFAPDGIITWTDSKLPTKSGNTEISGYFRARVRWRISCELSRLIQKTALLADFLLLSAFL